MDPYHLAAVAGATLAALILLWRLRPLPRFRRDMPYARREALLSRGELTFYRALLPAVPENAVICMKVRLADVVSVPGDAWREYGRPIAGMHLDFVLVDAETAAIILAVELDDSTHERRDRRERDALVDAVLASAGVPLVRFTAAARYDVKEIRARLALTR